jgi:hypothetical protein
MLITPTFCATLATDEEIDSQPAESLRCALAAAPPDMLAPKKISSAVSAKNIVRWECILITLWRKLYQVHLLAAKPAHGHLSPHGFMSPYGFMSAK